MKLKIICFFAFIFLAAIAAYFVHSNVSGEKIVRLKIRTDRPEFAFYADIFNAEHDEISVNVEYRADADAKDCDAADIVISPFLLSADFASVFADISAFFKKDTDFFLRFYDDLQKIGVNDSGRFLLPISFDAPVFLYDKNVVSPQKIMSADEMFALAAGFSEKNDASELTKIGFSPLLNNDFFHDYEFFSKKNAGQKQSESLLSWILAENISLDAENDFIDLNAHLRAEQMLENGILKFAYKKMSDFSANWMKKNAENREMLLPVAFSWVGDGENAVFCNDAVFAGVSKKTREKAAAIEFLRWFCDADVQKRLFERKNALHLVDEKFGLTSGFSALPVMNQTVFTQHYPFLFDSLVSVEHLKIAN